jgi:hypothetical protein
VEKGMGGSEPGEGSLGAHTTQATCMSPKLFLLPACLRRTGHLDTVADCGWRQ